MLDPRVFWQLSYGIYIVTTRAAGRCNGQIANTVFQVTAQPPTVGISLNRENLTHELVRQSGVFAVSVVSEAADMPFIGTFGFKCGRTTDKFAKIQTVVGELGMPIVTTNATGYLEAKVTHTLDVGTHTLFIGEVVAAAALPCAEQPMTYAFYHDVRKGKTPKNATTFLGTMGAAAGGGKYRCRVCGYEYDAALGDPAHAVPAGTAWADIPAGWVCPTCGVGKSEFSEVR